MKDIKRNKLWINFITCSVLYLIGFGILDIVNKYFEVNRDNSSLLYFAEICLIIILCSIVTEFIASIIKSIWKKRKSDKLILIIKISFSVISIILVSLFIIRPSFISMIRPNFLCVYALMCILFGALILIWEKKKSDKLILIIKTIFSVISIILVVTFMISPSFISMFMPNFIYIYPLIFTLLGVLNSVNGIKELEGNNKTIGKLMIVLSILIFLAAFYKI